LKLDVSIVNELSLDEKVKKTRIATYQRSLRSAVRGLWLGTIDVSQFNNAIESAINRGLTRAWQEGAQDCGIKPDELSQDELIALDERIIEELDRIPNLSQLVQANLKVDGGKLTPLFERLDLWTNRYRDISNQAKTMACADEKLIWRLGPTERHCRTCPRLDGKIKRGSTWLSLNLRPQNPPNALLECGGWNCLCELNPTDRPVSRGPLPRVP
jgi:hypothetical protein